MKRYRLMDNTKMTTRIPKTLKAGLDAEAKDLGITLNELTLAKLAQPLTDGEQGEVVPAPSILETIRQENQALKDTLALILSELGTVKASIASLQPAITPLPSSKMDTKEALADILDPAKETLEPELVATLEPEPEAEEESPSIKLTVAGATNKELAELLGISPNRLKNQTRYLAESGNVWVRRGEAYEARWYLEE